MSANPTKSLWEKIADAQRLVKPVETRAPDPERGEDKDKGRFAPAEKVLAAAAVQLRRRRIAAVPSMLSTARGTATVTARLQFTLTNLDDPADQLEFAWEGQGDTVSAAATAAAKGFYIHLFQIPTPDPPSRGELRAAAANGAPKRLTERQLHMIAAAQKDGGLTDDDLQALVADKFEVEKVELVPRHAAMAVVQAIKRAAK